MLLSRRCKFLSYSQFQFYSPSRNPSTGSFSTSACFPSAAEPSQPPARKTVADFSALRLSLVSSLARRGLLSAACNVIERIIGSSSPMEAAAALDYAVSLGITIDHSRLLRSLIASGHLHKADSLFIHSTKDRPSIDPVVLNSMIECYCKLGKLVLARAYLDELSKLGSLPTARAYITFLLACCAEDKYLDAFNLFCTIATQEGILPPLTVYNLMISGLCSIGCLDHARFMFDFMFNLGLQLTPRSYKSLVYVLSTVNRALEAEDICRKMEFRSIWRDHALLTSLINGYQKEGRIGFALKVFEGMKEATYCEPDTYTYNTIIHGLLQLNYVDSAWRLFNQMMKRGLKWNVVTYSMMINWYSKNGRVDRAMELMNEMSEFSVAPNLYCYTALVTSLCMERRFLEVEQLLDKMFDSGIAPDHVILALVIKTLSQGHRSMACKRTLSAIAFIDCNLDLSKLFTPSSFSNADLLKEIEIFLYEIRKSDAVAVIYGVLLSVLFTEGKFNVASILMEKMISWGYEPSIPTYNFLIRCICKVGQFDDAGSLARLCRQRRYAPSNAATYSIKINALCKIGHVDLAVEHLDEMIRKGFEPTVSIYDSIIGSLCRASRVNKANSIFKSMLNMGVNPDEVVYTTLINGYCVLGKVFRACHLFDQMIRRGLLPSSRAYSALINGLIKKNMFSNACHYLDRMLDDGFVPDIVLYTMLINQFMRKGDIRLSLNIFDSMVSNHIEPDLISYGSLICGLFRHKKYEINIFLSRKLIKARYVLYRLDFRGKIISRMLQDKRYPCMSITEKVILAFGKVHELMNHGLFPDLHIYNGLTNGLCRANRIEDVYELIAHMQDNGITPNQVTFTILMKYFIRSGNTDRAIHLFNEMNFNGCIPDNCSYNTLINGFCIAGRVLEGLSLAKGMQKRGLFPNKVLYDRLLECLVSCYPSNPAILLLEEMISHNFVPHLVNYNRLLQVLSSQSNLLEVRKVYNLILKIGRIPDEKTKRHLLKTCYRHGEFSLALSIAENKPIDND